LLDEATPLKDKVHAINLTDGAGARTTMGSFPASAILANAGFEPVLQLTCRDRNRIAITADLIGASAQGVHNLLVLTGDDPKTGDQPDAKPVFDYNSAQVLSLAAEMRDNGVIPSGREINHPPNFFLGAADVPQDPGPKWSPEGLIKKADAGAQFVQTQFCFDIEITRRYFERLACEGLSQRLSFLVGIGPIASARSARWMVENLWGVSIPEPVIERLENADDPKAEGRAICKELIAEFRKIEGIAGVHIMAPAQSAAAISTLMDEV
jgi:methylenetetrahydrofolate reductase (NADPH)